MVQRRSVSARALLAVLVVSLVAGEVVEAAHSATTSTQPAALVRVNQVGYVSGERKVAYLLAPAARPDVPFRVVDTHGSTVLHRRAGASRGRWNSRYGAVQPLLFNALHAAGRYRIVVGGSTRVVSPWFRVAPAPALLDPLIADTVNFFQAQRDGPDVIAGALQRKPSHLNDATAAVYAWPTYESRDSDVIVGDLTVLGGSTDVAGAGSTRATSSSSRTPRRTPTACCGRPSAGWGPRRPRRWRRRHALGSTGWPRHGIRPRACWTSRSASARATRPVPISATTTCGGCPRRTTRCPAARRGSSAIARSSRPTRRWPRCHRTSPDGSRRPSRWRPRWTRRASPCWRRTSSIPRRPSSRPPRPAA